MLERTMERVILNILAATSETKVEMLPAILTSSKMIISGDDTSQASVTSRYKNISRHARKIKWFETCF